VQPRPIEVETTEGDTALIAKGLNEGDQVVADGASQLRAGAKVQPRQIGQQQQRQAREGTPSVGGAGSSDGGAVADPPRGQPPKADTPQRGKRQ
jgi:hypothetical protein